MHRFPLILPSRVDKIFGRDNRRAPSDVTDDATIDMKQQPEPSTQEVLAGLVDRVTYHNARS
jgi:hypothetical protein